MKQSHPFVFSTGVIGYPILFVLTIWTVFWVEVTFGYDFNHFGIQPRTWVGLRGILFSPFIHSGMKHLFNNSVPLLVLSMALFYFYRKISWEILGYGLLTYGFSHLDHWSSGKSYWRERDHLFTGFLPFLEGDLFKIFPAGSLVAYCGVSLRRLDLVCYAYRS